MGSIVSLPATNSLSILFSSFCVKESRCVCRDPTCICQCHAIKQCVVVVLTCACRFLAQNRNGPCMFSEIVKTFFINVLPIFFSQIQVYLVSGTLTTNITSICVVLQKITWRMRCHLEIKYVDVVKCIISYIIEMYCTRYYSVLRIKFNGLKTTLRLEVLIGWMSL